MLDWEGEVSWGGVRARWRGVGLKSFAFPFPLSSRAGDEGGRELAALAVRVKRVSWRTSTPSAIDEEGSSLTGSEEIRLV